MAKFPFNNTCFMLRFLLFCLDKFCLEEIFGLKKYFVKNYESNKFQLIVYLKNSFINSRKRLVLCWTTIVFNYLRKNLI